VRVNALSIDVPTATMDIRHELEFPTFRCTQPRFILKCRGVYVPQFAKLRLGPYEMLSDRRHGGVVFNSQRKDCVCETRDGANFGYELFGVVVHVNAIAAGSARTVCRTIRGTKGEQGRDVFVLVRGLNA
jgi:hypothetical protein